MGTHDPRSAGALAGLPDRTLLTCYVERRDPAAFAALLDRHGPMVLGVCRRVLRNMQDAEDAFQATFLVLATKAGAVKEPQFVGTWLFEIATRTSLKLRSATVRRAARERRFMRLARPKIVPHAASDDGCEVIDGEIVRLPESYRQVVVLCCLQGHTRREAAAALGWPEGTVASRLSHAREMLRRRLERGRRNGSATASDASLRRKLAPALVPAALAASTLKAACAVAAGQVAAGAVSTQVIMLSKGATNAMSISPFKIAAAVGCVSFAVLATSRSALHRAPGNSQTRGPSVANPVLLPAASQLQNAGSGGTTPSTDDAPQAPVAVPATETVPAPGGPIRVALNQTSRAVAEDQDRETRACCADLRELIMALQKYTNDHGGHLPHDLGETVPYVLRGASSGQVTRATLVYLCPLEREKIKLPGKLTAEWVNKNTTYAYIGNPDVRLLDMHEGAYKMLWLYEKTDGGHHGKITIGYADGHAWTIEKKDLPAIIAESKALMEPAR